MTRGEAGRLGRGWLRRGQWQRGRLRRGVGDCGEAGCGNGGAGEGGGAAGEGGERPRVATARAMHSGEGRLRREWLMAEGRGLRARLRAPTDSSSAAAFDGGPRPHRAVAAEQP